jgi:hypothetical protein
MTFGPKIDAMFAAARRRLHKAIDVRCDTELGKDKASTVARRHGQLYRDRAAEAREAQLRG